MTIDFSSFDPDLPPQVTNSDDWVAGIIPLFTGLATTQHSMSNPLVLLENDAATITMNMQAHHVFDPDDSASWFTVGGYYDNTLVRVDSQWLLTEVRLTVTWRAGDPTTMELARVAGKRLLDS